MKKFTLSLFLLFVFLFVVNANDKADPIKVICLGNSITNGAPVYPPYPTELQALLDVKFGKGTYIVENYGVGGTTLSKVGNNPYWNQVAFTNAQKSEPDIVIIKFGTNDSKPYNWPKAEPTYADDIKEIVSVFQNLSSEPKVYLGIPTWVSQDAFNIQGVVLETEITPVIKATAAELELETIDFYTPVKDHADLYIDGVHLTKAGAKVLAQAAMDVITKDVGSIAQTETIKFSICPSVVNAGESITVNTNFTGKVNINIYDLSGRNIQSYTDNGQAIAIKAPNDRGTYILKLDDNVNSWDVKFTVK